MSSTKKSASKTATPVFTPKAILDEHAELANPVRERALKSLRSQLRLRPNDAATYQREMTAWLAESLVREFRNAGWSAEAVPPGEPGKRGSTSRTWGVKVWMTPASSSSSSSR